MAYECTLLVLKPDCASRGLVGEIISRFERKKFDIIEMNFKEMTNVEIESLYESHKGKAYYERLFMSMRGSCIVIAVGRFNAVAEARKLAGAAIDPVPGTIRGDYAASIASNIIHTSDSMESAKRELEIFFKVGII